ncbi:arginine--tRNA ligase, partial [Candidatus Parcubacteria bacterium]
MVAQEIKDALKSALAAVGVSAKDVSLEHTELSHGDYATGVALQYAKQTGKNPRELAEEIKTALGTIPGVLRIEIAGPGFINFHLSPEVFSSVVEKARTEDMWGAN